MVSHKLMAAIEKQYMWGLEKNNKMKTIMVAFSCKKMKVNRQDWIQKFKQYKTIKKSLSTATY